MSPICGIYLITHRETGRGYVGLSKDIRSRWSAHRNPSDEQYVGRAVNKYGHAAFTFDVLEECEFANLGEREMHWVSQLETHGPKGFNMNPGGSTCIHTPESKRKIAEALRGVPKTAEHNAKVSAANKGQLPSDEQRALFSDAAKRRWQDPEKRAVLMLSRSAPRTHSEQTKAQMSLSASQILADPAARQRRSEAMTRHMSDPAVRKARSDSMKAYRATMKSNP